MDGLHGIESMTAVATGVVVRGHGLRVDNAEMTDALCRVKRQHTLGRLCKWRYRR